MRNLEMHMRTEMQVPMSSPSKILRNYSLIQRFMRDFSTKAFKGPFPETCSKT